MKKSVDDTADTIGKMTRYVRLIILICTLFTIISSIIFYMIASKVTTAINPMLVRMAAAEEKLSSYIIANDKTMAVNFKNSQDIFTLTCKNIEKEINAINARQTTMSLKLDDVIRLLLREKVSSSGPPPVNGP